MNHNKKNIADQVRTGGKGSQRRKKKIVHKKKNQTADTKALLAQFKRLGMNPIPGIEEVSFVNAKDSTVRIFKSPQLQASIQANTFVITGSSDVKKLKDVVKDEVAKPEAEVPNMEGINFEDVATKTDAKKADSDEAPQLAPIKVTADAPVQSANVEEPAASFNIAVDSPVQVSSAPPAEEPAFSISVENQASVSSAPPEADPVFSISVDNPIEVSSAPSAEFSISPDNPVVVSSAPDHTFDVKIDAPVEVSTAPADVSIQVAAPKSIDVNVSASSDIKLPEAQQKAQEVTIARAELAEKAAEALLSASTPKIKAFTITRQEDTFPRLIRISAQGATSGSSYNQEMTTSLVTLEYQSLNTKDMFILDNNDTVYQWGQKPSLFEKSYTTQITRALDDERKSAVDVKVLDNLYDLKDSDVKDFWELMGIKGEYPKDLSDDDSAPGYPPQIYSIQDKKFTLVEQGKNIKKTLLTSNQVMLLDTGFEIYIWLGKSSPKAEQSYATLKAHTDYIKEKSRPDKIKVTVLLEGSSASLFDHFFK